MAKVTYERGIKCKKCGKIIISFDRHKQHILCQDCGTHIMDFDIRRKHGEVTQNADIISVKITHKLFKEIYEEVSPIY